MNSTGKLARVTLSVFRQSRFHTNHHNVRLISTSSINLDSEHARRNHPSGKKTTWFAVLLGGGCIASLTAYKSIQAFTDTKHDSKQEEIIGKQKLFTRKEVAQHDSLDRGVWITYKGNVYDITKFIQHHPGGSHTIMMGAGGDVEPFWQTYTVHHANEVQGLLSQYQIGQLIPEEREQKAQPVLASDGPYANDPIRSPLLKVLSKQPYNAETPAKLLPLSYITPAEIFFVRNHLPVPEVDLPDYTVSICIGSDADQENLKVVAELTLDDLKTKFKAHSVDSIIQCSGNRRSDLKKLKEIKGLDWEVGAISNARWTGARLIDVLDSLGLKLDESEYKHVQMEGLDCDMTGQSYGASISSDIAFDPKSSVLLAYEMNGQPLTRDHGFPVRFIAPGVTGARNVKWLSKIILSHEESNSHWQRKDYKSFSPNVDMFSVNFDESISIQETPVQSAICDPVDGDTVTVKLQTSEKLGEGAKPFVPVKGYAFSGGGKMIIRVDVSVDGGGSWQTANLSDVPRGKDGQPDYTTRNKVYSWTRWSADVPVSGESIKSGKMEIICRAFDSTYNSQPERPETVWNVRGVVNNSWHRVKLNLNFE